MSLARTERTALCDTLEKTGPDQPTLCAGWSTHDLLTHLLVRERKPWAAPGILVSALAPLTDRAMASYGNRSWEDLVGQLRAGAPAWSPYSVGAIDENANGAEFFVHHEDVRRAEEGWEPRPADPERDTRLWTMLQRMGRLLYRTSPVGIVVRRPSGETHVLRTGPGLVTIVGEPGEIVLHAFGRDEHARVELEGADGDVAKLTGTSRGL
jgi:uncharacterized protein (TIGR03085 family)